MTHYNDGGPAFPRPASEYTRNGTCPDGNDPIEDQDGMSLRHYFAGQALAGMLANPAWNTLALELAGVSASKQGEAAAVVAFSYADAMLAARDK